MSFDDFGPAALNNRISSNASVRSSSSKLSLTNRNRLTLGGKNVTMHNFNESQRLSPLPESRTLVSNKAHLNKPHVEITALNLPGPEPKIINTSLGSLKENFTEQGNINHCDEIAGIKKIQKKQVDIHSPKIVPSCGRRAPNTEWKTPQKEKAPSPAKSTPRKVTPSPCKSNKASSTASARRSDVQGYCFVCQVPFNCINILPSVHASGCSVPEDNPECPNDLACKERDFKHYVDFKHTTLAEMRSLELNGVEESQLPADEESDLLRESDDENRLKRRRSVGADDDCNAKRTSTTKIHEESSPFFDVIDDESARSQQIEQNPFMDSNLSDLDGNVESVASEIDDASTCIQSVPNMESDQSAAPCLPGICDTSNLGVTFTIEHSSGQEIKVQGIANADGWLKIEGRDQNGVSVKTCRCQKSLNIACNSTLTTTEKSAATLAAKAAWGPLMKRMTASSTSSVAEQSITGTPSTSSFNQRKCPYSKKIPNTKFAIDAFSYGDIPGIKYYFLTHFHSDHYMGLTSKWKNVIYCSAITARLLGKAFKINSKHIRILELNQPKNIDGVVVTALDANHCPGSLMLLFQLSDGTNHFHTGDFRATPYMESHSTVWNCYIDKLFLDTTYCNASYDFPSQDDVVTWIAETAKTQNTQHPNTLFVCGSYSIGKEKAFLAVAETLESKIWANAKKISTLRCLEDNRINERLTANATDAAVHVLPMQSLTFKLLKKHLLSQKKRYSKLVAFKPSGWQFSATNNNGDDLHKLQQSENISIYCVPYSEHSSFSELKRFVQFIGPRSVVPTVRTKDRSWEEIRKTCNHWLTNSMVSQVRRR